MVTQKILKKWITDTLKNDSEFEQFCADTIGESLNFYRSSPINEVSEVTPYLTAFSGVTNNDDTEQNFFKREWHLQVSIAIDEEDNPVDDDDVSVWDSTDKVESVAEKAIETLKQEARCGINGEDILIVSYTLVVTEIGEAETTQAILQLQFGKVTHI